MARREGSPKGFLVTISSVIGGAGWAVVDAIHKPSPRPETVMRDAAIGFLLTLVIATITIPSRRRGRY